MSKGLVAAIAAVAGVGVGLICGIVGTASLPNDELEKLRKDMGIPIVPKEADATNTSKGKKVEG